MEAGQHGQNGLAALKRVGLDSKQDKEIVVTLSRPMVVVFA